METTGRSIEDAKEAALDRLGVDEPDAEFEIVEQAKAGLFGRVRREARVRARIRPTRPRAKDDRRDRRRRNSGRARNGPNRGSGKRTRTAARGDDAGGRSTPTAPQDESNTGAAPGGPVAGGGSAGHKEARSPGSKSPESKSGSGRRRRRGRGRASGSPPGGNGSEQARSDGRDQDEGHQAERRGQKMSEVSLEEQGEMVQDFLDGLVEAFELDGDLQSEEIDEEMIEVQVVGDDLGLLIGPKGQTLAAIQELARTVVQRRAEGNPRGRFRVDVGGYRQRRREALERFAQSVAEEVKAGGVQKALEPMNAADRKVVHDTINDLDGVETTSEGEEPRRRVVILPAG